MIFGTASTLVSEAYDWSSASVRDFGGSILEFAQGVWINFQSFDLAAFIENIGATITFLRDLWDTMEGPVGRFVVNEHGDIITDIDAGSNPMITHPSATSICLSEMSARAATAQSVFNVDDERFLYIGIQSHDYSTDTTDETFTEELPSSSGELFGWSSTEPLLDLLKLSNEALSTLQEIDVAQGWAYG